MARENSVQLHGQVRKNPQIQISNGNLVRAMLSIKVIRRTQKDQNFDTKLYFDCPVLFTKNEDMIKCINTLKVNDMIDVKGVVSTRDVNKTSTCPVCGGKNQTIGTLMYITPLYIKKCDSVKDDTEGIQTLKSRSEISNIVKLIGNLCKEPEYYEDGKNMYASFPLAVNRRYHIKEDPDEKRTDYPWIKTYGMKACEDSKKLHLGSSVFIDGALQSRQIIRSTVCEHCENLYNWDDTVGEIVPYYIGYLTGCGELDDTEEVIGEVQISET